MEEDIIKQVQWEGADALLDVGASVPLKVFRIPPRRKPAELRVTMKRPYLSGRIRFVRTYLSMEVTSEQMWNFGKEEEMEPMAGHGKKISRMIAYTIYRGWWSHHLLLWPTSWFVRNFMEQPYLLGAVKRLANPMGMDPFIPVIRSAEMTNPVKLRLGQKREGN